MCSVCMYAREQYSMPVCAYVRMRVRRVTGEYSLRCILFESYMRLRSCAACVCKTAVFYACLCVYTRVCVGVCGA